MSVQDPCSENTRHFLSELNTHGITLWFDEYQLRYRAPAGALTPALRSETVRRKAELLTYFQQRQAIPLQPIPPISRDKELLLSFAQQRLWFLDQLEGPSATYNESAAWQLRGPLNIAVLEESLTEIVRRHEVLRTTFCVQEDGVPMQVIAPPSRITLPMIDLQMLPSEQAHQEVQRLAFEETQRPFDLATGPLLRFTLLRLGVEEHVLLQNIHHIVFDGWSSGLFFHELQILYHAFLLGRPSPLPELSIQYADFAHWQRHWWQGERLQEQLAYWKQQFADAPPVLALPTDRPRPARQTFRGRLHAFGIEPEIVEKLERLSKQSGTTLFMTLLAAFVTLLARYSNQMDIVIGTPIANRNRDEIESLIGCFTNTLALCLDLSAELTFRELLAQVRRVTLDAYAYQALPFEKLVEELQPERSLSHFSLFQVMFAFQNFTFHQSEPKGDRQNDRQNSLTMTPLAIERGTAKVDLTLFMIPDEQELLGTWEYNSDLFEEATIKRMTGHFQTLLAGIVADPNQRISELSLLTTAERHHLLVEWNAVQIDYPRDRCIHQLFEEQVERTPDTVAVVFEDQQLTYRELNERANHLAHYLIQQGVGPEVLVGVCMERSIEMIVGLLAILKAGRAYVPLDPAYPQEHLQFMLEDAQITIMLTQRKLLMDLPAFAGTQVCLDRLPATEATNPNCACSPTNLAYVLFTSGSTGRPKGVAIEHRSTVAFLTWAGDVFAAEKQAGILASATISFDLSVFEMFLPLVNGGRVILAENALVLPNLQDVTLVNTVPSAMKELVRMGGIPASVRVVNLAGEPLKNQLVQQIYQQSNVQKVYNLYGPSEDTTYSTYTLIERDATGEPTIGRPIANTQAYILDRQLQPVPIGVPGELHLSGDGLARGYLSRPELTKEKFIANPFSDDPTARLYKTGDLCRYLLDGNIEFLGRIDHQVKVRGFRIELGEIEAHLAQHPAVQEVVVVVHEEAEDKRLVAYLVGKEALNSHTLRTYLSEKLPDYMIPSAFVQLEEMLLTPNGKINRRALTAPDYGPDEATLVLPRTPVEKCLVAIWQDVLRLERVGITDNFFMIGGHSLLATQIVFRIRQQLRIDLPLRSLFEHPTVAGLAAYIGATTGTQAQAMAGQPPLYTNGFASPNGQALTERGTAERTWVPLTYTQCPLIPPETAVEQAYVNSGEQFSIRSEISIPALRGAYQALAARHGALRLRVTHRNGVLMQQVQPEADVPFAEIDAGGWSQAQLAEQVAAVWQYRFDLQAEPPLRVYLFTRAPDENILVLLIHHIATDGWSMQIIREELPLLYQAQVTRVEVSLPPLPWSFTDYVRWQHEMLAGPEGEQLWQYWQQQLAGPLPILNLPTDHPRPAVISHRGTGYEFHLARDLTQQLRQLAQRQGVTLYILMQAGFQLLLHGLSGQPDILVGMTINNRVRPEVDRLVGCLVDATPLRSILAGDLPFTQYLSQVRATVLDALAHQGYPSTLLAERLGIQENANRPPLVQVSLNYLHATMLDERVPDAPLTVSPGALTLERCEIPVPLAGNWKEDLILGILEEQDQLRGLIRYNTDLFEATTIAHMAEAFQMLLAAIVDNPEQSIATLLQAIVNWERR